MAIEHRSGDLFAQKDLQAVGHGVNCKGKMGSGIAVEFRNRFPIMHKRYVELCDQEKLQLGMVYPYQHGNGLWVYNLASQYNPGADARLGALEESVSKALVHAEQRGVKSLGLPQIGAGIGGLSWEDEVRPTLERLGEASPVKLVIVTYAP